MTVCTSLAIGLVLFVFFLILKGRLAYIFTDNQEVARAVADLSPLLALSILLNSVQPVLSGNYIYLHRNGFYLFIHMMNMLILEKEIVCNQKNFEQELLLVLDGKA